MSITLAISFHTHTHTHTQNHYYHYYCCCCYCCYHNIIIITIIDIIIGLFSFTLCSSSSWYYYKMHSANKSFSSKDSPTPAICISFIRCHIPAGDIYCSGHAILAPAYIWWQWKRSTCRGTDNEGVLIRFVTISFLLLICSPSQSFTCIQIDNCEYIIACKWTWTQV